MYFKYQSNVDAFTPIMLSGVKFFKLLIMEEESSHYYSNKILLHHTCILWDWILCCNKILWPYFFCVAIYSYRGVYIFSCSLTLHDHFKKLHMHSTNWPAFWNSTRKVTQEIIFKHQEMNRQWYHLIYVGFFLW